MRQEQMMLTLTESAVTAIRNLTSQPELPDETGLRIMSQSEGGPAFQVTLAESPVTGDQVIETEGARVFLEAGAAVALDDKALDAQVDDEGTVAFTLAEQAM
jgi:iron-sulfur cluster assembly protein